MILLLSSEPLLRSILKEVLEDAGYVVVATGDLGSAVDSLSDQRIDLLITHPYVENIPGYEAAKYLHKKDPHMGVLFVAGILDDDRLQYRADLEHFEIFPEPFTAQQFLLKVKATLKSAIDRLSV
jgi:DNA-binding NtrC family response regulator